MPQMPIDQILTLLIAERDKLNRAIEIFQGTKRRPGRPPRNPTAAPFKTPTSPPADGGRRTMSAELRKAQSKRMKAFWAKRKKHTPK
jgi:hypothetical protein